MGQETVPGEKGGTAPHLVLVPTVAAPDGSQYVHADFVKVTDPWAVESHIGPIKTAEQFGDVDSWAQYVSTYGRKTTLLSWSPRGLRAVLDYHSEDGTPGRCAWTAQCPFSASPEWAAWSLIATGEAIPHRKAVELLEDRGEDIKEPDAVSLMALLRNLRAYVSATAQTELRPDGTTAVSFAQDKKIQGAVGSVDLPYEIKIGIPILKGHVSEDGKPVAYRLAVRLRASVDDSAHLSLRFSIPNSERVLEEVYAERVEAAKRALGSEYRILRGTP